MAPFFSVQKDPNSVLVFLPDSLMIGAFSSDNFIHDVRSGMELDINFSATFVSNGKSQANIILSGYTTVASNSLKDNPGAGFGRAAYVVPSAIVQSGQGRLSINLPAFQAKDVSYEQKSAGGRVWYCLR